MQVLALIPFLDFIFYFSAAIYTCKQKEAPGENHQRKTEAPTTLDQRGSFSAQRGNDSNSFISSSHSLNGYMLICFRTAAASEGPVAEAGEWAKGS